MKIPSFARNALAALVLATLTAPAVHAQDATLTQAKRMIDTQRGQGRGAFELLSPLEEARAGDPEFDYLLGLAATDAGEYTRAVFALERVLAVRPDHPQARAEIARAYFLMGENRTARAEFEAVKAAKPPSEVIATIDRFLSALDQRQSAARSGLTAYVELGFGYDSNANVATSSGNAIPTLNGLQPNFNPNNSARTDTFSTIAAGFSGRYLVTDNWSISGGANLNRRYNSVAGRGEYIDGTGTKIAGIDTFDTGSIDGNVGVMYLSGNHELSAIIQAQTFDVDERRFRDAFGGVLQWRYALSATQQIVAYGQSSRLIYPNRPGSPTQTDRNALREILGFAWAGAFDTRFQPSAYLGVYGGEERLMQTSFPEFGHKVIGARVGGQLTLTPLLTAFANLSVEERRYGYPASPINLNFFNYTSSRGDREWNVRIGANYAFAKNWTFSPNWTLTENHSNWEINRFRRNMVQATIRYDFR